MKKLFPCSIHLFAFALASAGLSIWATAQGASPEAALGQADLTDATVRQMSSNYDDCLTCDTCYSDTACGCVPSPCWTFSTSWVFLNRANMGDAVLYDDGTTTLGAPDLRLGWQSGYELEVVKHGFSKQDAIVARLLVVDGWTAPARIQFAGATDMQTNPVTTMAGPNAIDTTLSSDLVSFELDYVWQCDWASPVRWLFGFRTVELDELLSTYVLDPASGTATAQHAVGTQNRLYGFQAGTDFDICYTNRMSLSGLFAAGVYGNTARHESFVIDNSAATQYMTDRSCTASFVGETGLGAKYLFTPGITLRADYRVLWVTGLALAPEQVGVTTFPIGTGIDDDGTAFYHGFFLGVDWTY